MLNGYRILNICLAGLVILFAATQASPSWRTQTVPIRIAVAQAQTSPTKSELAFAVADIKLSPSETRNKGIRFVGHQLLGTSVSVRDLITYSYSVHRQLVTGGPAWLMSTLYDVKAEPEAEGQPSDQQWKEMVRTLLRDRFQFSYHRQQRELSVFTLSLVRPNSKLKPNTTDSTDVPSMGFRLGNLVAKNASMADLAWLLQDALMDRPVLDQTQLTGRFDFSLDWTPDDSQFAARGIATPPATDPDKAPPNLFTAMREQLGIKLEAKKRSRT